MYKIVQLIPSGYKCIIQEHDGERIETEKKRIDSAISWVINNARENIEQDDIKFFGIDLAMDIVGNVTSVPVKEE